MNEESETEIKEIRKKITLNYDNLINTKLDLDSRFPYISHLKHFNKLIFKYKKSSNNQTFR